MAPILGLFGLGGGQSVTSVAAGGEAPFGATGGDQNGITPGNGYKYHTYYTTGPANFVVDSGTRECYVMVLGGGGSGGDSGGGESGGGGAGGMCYHNAFELEPGTYPIVVGDGGPESRSPSTWQFMLPGEDSTFAGSVKGSAFTMTGRRGCGGFGPNSNLDPQAGPTGKRTYGCGPGNLSPTPGPPTGWWSAIAGQPTYAQPGVPAGYSNFGFPGGRNDSAGYGSPSPSSGGGGGGGCGSAGGGNYSCKTRVNTTTQGRSAEIDSNLGGIGWAAPEVLEYPHVFGPQSPTVNPYSPTQNHYGAGGCGNLGARNTELLSMCQFGGYGQPGGPAAGGSWGLPGSRRPGASSPIGPYGGGGYGMYPQMPWAQADPFSFPVSQRNGADRLGSGGSAGEGSPTATPTTQAGQGGSGLVVIAYLDDGQTAATKTEVPVSIWGAGGGGGPTTNSTGGGGGYYTGTLNLLPGTYTFCVGSSGQPAPAADTPGNSGFGGAPASTSQGAGGGGYSGFIRKDFSNDPTANQVLANWPNDTYRPSVPTSPTPAPISLKGMTSFPGTQPPQANTWQGGGSSTGPGDGAMYAELQWLHSHAIFLVGGGGGGGNRDSGGGGGGHGAGDPAIPGPTGPGSFQPEYDGVGANPTTIPEGSGGGLGAIAPAPDGNGRGGTGKWMMGGWAGPAYNNCNGGGGGGYFGGGQGADGPTPLKGGSGGGGSGYIHPEYVTGASGETGNPGVDPTGAGNAGGHPSPLIPSPKCGQGGIGPSNTGVTAGAVVFGPHGGTLAVTPPGGSPASVPTSGQAFETAGVYKLVIT